MALIASNSRQGILRPVTTMKAYERLSLLCCSLLIIGLLPSCTMQSSGSALDANRHKSKPEQTVALLEQQGNSWMTEGKPVKTNYLTTLSSIRNPSLIVFKEKRRLCVLNADVVVRDYPVGLGTNPTGDKETEGDGRTPEGEFFICQKGPSGHYSKVLILSYPSRQHAERALFHGVITPIEFHDILSALENRAKPPWTARLGGEILIHGGGAHLDWTDGSIALYDSDMEEIVSIVNQGTPIRIRP
jgi:murein L,D-transpeptidase YafK